MQGNRAGLKHQQFDNSDVEDAEFIVIHDARDRHVDLNNARANQRNEPKSQAYERQQNAYASLNPSLSKLKGQVPPDNNYFSKRGGWAFWSLSGLIVVSVFWIFGGYALVFPPKDPISNFSLHHLVTKVNNLRKGSYIQVRAMIKNEGSKLSHIPEMVLLIWDRDNHIGRYKLGTTSKKLDAGQTFLVSKGVNVQERNIRKISAVLSMD